MRRPQSRLTGFCAHADCSKNNFKGPALLSLTGAGRGGQMGMLSPSSGGSPRGLRAALALELRVVAGKREDNHISPAWTGLGRLREGKREEGTEEKECAL